MPTRRLRTARAIRWRVLACLARRVVHVCEDGGEREVSALRACAIRMWSRVSTISSVHQPTTSNRVTGVEVAEKTKSVSLARVVEYRPGLFKVSRQCEAAVHSEERSSWLEFHSATCCDVSSTRGVDLLLPLTLIRRPIVSTI
jgi:hypothetical protein